jgi:two-component system NarL family sensor kinase/two-component system sensor histidine kinase UhpB
MKLSPTPPALRDLLRVLVIVGMFWLLAMQLELSEKLADWVQSYERFQLDEMPLTLLVLSISLAWFAFRRIHEVSDLLTANRHLTQRLMSAQEDERRVLAQELHDEVGQACTALRIEAAYITKAIHNNPTAALEAAQRIDQSSLRMHTLARDMLKRLRPPNLDSMGLEESLKALCRSWEQHCRTPCHALVEALPNNLADPLCTSLYRVTQEALTNVAKHAHATQVWVSLHNQQEVLTLIITDNGQGLQRSHSSTHGLGLTGMRERIASLQGQIHFEDAQPGLRIHVQVPLAKASP